MDAVSQDLEDSRADRFSSENPSWECASTAQWRRLFLALACGSSEALERLYDLSAQRLYGLALWRTGSEDDARDVVQDVFVRLAEQGRRLSRVRDPRAWLLSVTHRAAVDVTRRRARRRAVALDQAPLLVAEQAPAELAVDAERASRLLMRLPPAQRLAIFLHLFAGCTFTEVGRATGVPTFTAASRYRLGLGRLRRMMEATP